MPDPYIRMKYVRSNTIERREYQVSMAEQASRENCIVVLPTGLGKTAVALQVIASYLAGATARDVSGAALLLAPTRVLASQHYDFLQNALTIDDIALVTGEDSAKSRTRSWNSSVVCATPEIARNDLARGMISPDMFGMVVFDEAHRAVGDYAYSAIAEMLGPVRPLILGMTATLPSDKEKATEIMTNLRIANVVERNESSPDVTPYIQKTRTEWFRVDLTPEIAQMRKLLQDALKARCRMLRGRGVHVDDSPSLSGLLRLRDYVLQHNRSAATPLFTAIRIHYALSTLEAHGIAPFLEFCKRTRAKKSAGTRELFESDPNFTRALALAERARDNGTEHPKVAKLIDVLLEIKDSKVLIFTSYRDSVDMICDALKRVGIETGKLIGKSGQTGLKQKQQIETVRRFRDGEFRVMVATRVGEEGLDIAEVNHVIFYDNVPSSIRYVQRRGRTGRRAAGRLIVLIARGTIDEAYHWIGRRKIKTAQSMGNVLSGMLDSDQDGGRNEDVELQGTATGGRDDPSAPQDASKLQAKDTGLDGFM